MDRQMLEYLPPIMRTFAEFIEISKAEQKAKEKLWDDINRMFAEGYVIDESEIGASRWEKTLGITAKDNEDIEVRNFRIRGKLQSDLPYTYRTLKRQLAGLCGENGYTLTIDYDACTITIKVALSRGEMKDEVENLTDEVIPAHILLVVELMYNTHGMIARAGKTHADLAQLTHAEIKEQPFE